MTFAEFSVKATEKADAFVAWLRLHPDLVKAVAYVALGVLAGAILF